MPTIAPGHLPAQRLSYLVDWGWTKDQNDCIGTAVEWGNQGIPLAICANIMARYGEAAATYLW